VARRSRRLLTLALLTVTTMSVGSCKLGEDTAFQIGALTIGPNPAEAGQDVTFAFGLTIVPEKRVTITAFINDVAYHSEEKILFWDSLYELELGSADPMIAQFGVGVHTARVQVFIIDEGRTLANSPIAFELR